MATETFVIDSPLPPTAAFERLIDLERVTEWDRGIRGSVLLDGVPGTVGARYEVGVTGFDGQPTTVVYELTAVDAPQSFTMVGEHVDFRAEDTAVVEPAGAGCRVTYQAGLVLLGEKPPLDESQLAKAFVKIAAVAEAGLTDFLRDDV